MRIARSMRLALVTALATTLLLGPAGSGATTSAALESAPLPATGLGNPYVSFRDGSAVPTSYSGEAALRSTLDLAAPRSLASADFDDDGMPDLVAGYATDTGGLLALHRGNVDAMFPGAPEALQRKAAGAFSDAAFLPAAALYAAPSAPDFLAAGDFDNDGQQDLLVAARGDRALQVLPGDGSGGFGAPQALALDGGVTALLVEDLNRRDGLPDIAVAVDGAEGTALLVFESPLGALFAQPERFVLAAPALALAAGNLDGHYAIDLAIGAGKELLVVHGRDRKLSLGQEQRDSVAPAALSRQRLASPVVALAAGFFRSEQGADLALLTADGLLQFVSTDETGTLGVAPLASGLLSPAALAGTARPQLVAARVSSLPREDLLLLEPGAGLLRVVDPGAAERGLAPLLASMPAAGGAALLPLRINGDALHDLVLLQDGQAAPVMSPSTPNHAFVVDSTGDAGDNDIGDGACTTSSNTCTLRAAIEEANMSAGPDSISFNIGDPRIILPRVISPAYALPTITDALTINGSGHSYWVVLNGSQTAGEDVSGLKISAGNSTVNSLVIQQFSLDGIGLTINGGNLITGNRIGTNTGGSAAVGNSRNGVYMSQTAQDMIGGTVAAARNIISGNYFGATAFATSQTIVQGNYVGTNAAGNAAVGLRRGSGITFNNAVNGTLGSTVSSWGRNIVANSSQGVFLTAGEATGHLVVGNYLGTDVSGTSAISNSTGIAARGANDVTIGGTGALAGNLVSGNQSAGIEILGGLETSIQGTLIQGNLIGTDGSGTMALGNAVAGISLYGPAEDIIIGGWVSGARNVISGNQRNGIDLLNLDSGLTAIQGNLIGVDVSGSAPLGNGGHGVLATETSNLLLGGYDPRQSNQIAYNAGSGVTVVSGIRNRLNGNLIHSNGEQGIDLGADGVSRNDSFDVDSGANEFQNYPVIRDVSGESSNPTVTGTLHSTPNTSFTIVIYANDACDSTGYGEGQRYPKLASVTTNSTGNATWSTTLEGGYEGIYLTAQAIDPAGNTSEFSRCWPEPIRVHMPLVVR